MKISSKDENFSFASGQHSSGLACPHGCPYSTHDPKARPNKVYPSGLTAYEQQFAQSCNRCSVTSVRTQIGLSRGKKLDGRMTRTQKLATRQPYPIYRTAVIDNKVVKTRRRSIYRSVYRNERKVISHLLKCPPICNSVWKEYKAIRYIYYCVCPYLMRRLSLPTDQQLLSLIASRYFAELKLFEYRFKRCKRRLVNRPIHYIASVEKCPHTCGPLDKL